MKGLPPPVGGIELFWLCFVGVTLVMNHFSSFVGKTRVNIRRATVLDVTKL